MLVTLSESLIKQHLADATVLAAQELRDTCIRGLCLRIGKIRHTWCIHVAISKKTYRVKLGTWPCITLEEARRRALDWLYRHREQWNEGRLCTASAATTAPAITPQAASVATPASNTPDTCFADALALYCQHKAIKPNTLRSYQDAFRFHLASLNQAAVSSLTSKAVNQLYQQLLTTLKPATANLQIRVLKAIYRFWYAYHGLVAPDVFSTLKTIGNKQQSAIRTRYLTEHDLQALGRQWDKLTDTEQDFLAIGLCTGFRLSELKSLTAQSYDPIRQTLHLPSTKNGKAHTLPVASCLHKRLARLCKTKPSKLLSGHLHNYASIISKKTGIEFSCHDLRRTFATYATKAGVASYIVKAMLNHADHSDVTATHYVHLGTDDLSEAVQTTASKINHWLNIDFMSTDKI